MHIRDFKVITPSAGDYIGTFIDNILDYLAENEDQQVLVLWQNKHYFANKHTTKNDIINYFLNVD